jgi:hypothetical protein
MKKIHGIRLPRVTGSNGELEQTEHNNATLSSSAQSAAPAKPPAVAKPNDNLNMLLKLTKSIASSKQPGSPSQQDQLTSLLGKLITNYVQQQQNGSQDTTDSSDNNVEQPTQINQNVNNSSSNSPMIISKCALCAKKFANRGIFKKHLLLRHRLTYSSYLAKTGGNHSAQNGHSSLKLAAKTEPYSQPKFTNGNQTQNVNLNSSQNNQRKRKNSASSCSALSTSSSCDGESFSPASSVHSITKSNVQEMNGGSSNKKSKLNEYDPTTEMANKLNDVLSVMKKFYSGQNVNGSENSKNMQAFIIENEDTDSDYCLMQPCVVYLPVTSRINTNLSLKIKLKPVDSNSPRHDVVAVKKEDLTEGVRKEERMHLQEQLKN